MRAKRKKVVILGGAGFLGRHLACSLASDGAYVVVVFDKLPNDVGRRMFKNYSRIYFFRGDFLKREDVRSAIKDAEYVFHFISTTCPASSMNDPFIDMRENVCASIMLFEECAAVGVRKIVFASSGGAIYGNQGKKSYSEDDQANPITPHAIGKLTIEKYLAYFKLQSGLDYTILRYANPYGQEFNTNKNQGIIPILLRAIKNGEPVNVYGDGENIRDYIYIEDAILLTKKIIFNEENKYPVYNIGTGIGYSINALLKVITDISNKEIVVRYLPKRSSDIKAVILNNSRIKSEIGKYPFVSLAEGIERLWEQI